MGGTCSRDLGKNRFIAKPNWHIPGGHLIPSLPPTAKPRTRLRQHLPAHFPAQKVEIPICASQRFTTAPVPPY